MPKIIKASGKRSAPAASKRTARSGAEVAESVGFDANLKFLYSFEEIDPVAEGVVVSRAGKKKEKKVLKKAAEKKKTKPRKQSKSDKVEKPEQNGHESEAIPSEEKPKKRKKKLRKKAPASEKPAKEAKKDGKKRKAKPATADPQSPAKREKLDMNEWSELGLSEPVMEALEAMGYTRPTQIQKEVIPVALTNRCDVLGAAETGSGKTLAFAIPMVERLLQTGAQDSDKLSALVLAPTRELALQVHKEIERTARFTPLKSVLIVGGLSQQKQERLLQGRPHIVVATPGRLWALMESAPTDHTLGDLSALKLFVVDEIDRMVERGHFDELEMIIRRVKDLDNAKCQTLVFSATLTFVHTQYTRKNGQKGVVLTPEDKLKRLVQAAGIRKERKVIDISQKTTVPTTLVEKRMNCADLLQKDTTVYYLLKRYPGRTLIFTNSIDAARRLRGILVKLQLEPPAQILHARMIEKKRLKNLERFTESDNSVIISTDVAARGLDIKGVKNVVHYQVPKTAENYVHRSGRTARASSSGMSVLLVDPTDVTFYHRICKNLKRDSDIDTLEVDSRKLFAAASHRVDLATRAESMEFRLKKASTKREWYKKAAEEADLSVDDEFGENDDDDTPSEEAGLRRQKKRMEAQLKAALRQPLPAVPTAQ